VSFPHASGLIEALGIWFLGLILMYVGEFPAALSYLDKVTTFYDPNNTIKPFCTCAGRMLAWERWLIKPVVYGFLAILTRLWYEARKH
jgi:hypothetical protein